MEERDSDLSSEEEEVDPRVQGELENLNSASNDINILETELEKSRNKFRSLLGDSTQRLNILYKKLGKVVLKARPYYDLRRDARRAQAEAQRAAVQFQRANSIYKAAKETVSLAEEKIVYEGAKREFDSAWQEMLNHATMKFMESETEKAKSEQEHLMKAAEYAAITSKLRFYEKDMPRSISKARPYFDLKEKLEHSLQLERQNVDDLQRALMCSKFKYKEALKSLEAISEDIHRKRRKRLKLPPRTPGVGAESTADQSDLPSINLDNLSDTCSFASLDELEADGASLRELDQTDFEKQLPVITSGFETIDICNDGTLEVSHMLSAINGDNAGLAVAERLPPLGVQGSGSVSKEDPHSSSVHSMKPVASCPDFTPDQLNLKTSTANSLTVDPPIGRTFAINTATDVTETGIYIPRIVPPPPQHGPAQGQGHMPRAHVRPPPAPKSKTEQKKLQTRMAFPMLQGLSDIHLRMSPKVSRANAMTGGHPSPNSPLKSKTSVRQETPGGEVGN